LIWKSLPDSEKLILNLRDQLKFEFNETNRTSILKSLDHSNWALCLTKKDKNLHEIVALIEHKSEELVLKPQREGGGNNIYKSDIK